jgi:hypothetical protein
MKKHLLPITCTDRFMHEQGFKGGRVDHQFGPITRDYMGWMDCLYRRPALSLMTGIQVTSKDNISTHINKYRDDINIQHEIMDWIASGHVAMIHGWWYKEKTDKKTRLDGKRYGLLEFVGRVAWSLDGSKAQLDWEPTRTLYPIRPDFFKKTE